MRETILKVTINGNDVTANFAPVLKDIKISLSSKNANHTCDITLMDKDGLIQMPEKGAEVVVELGLQGEGAGEVFRGTVNDVTSKGDRSGRELSITSTSADQNGKVKQQQLDYKDDATFEDAAKQFGSEAGIEVTVIGDVAKVFRDYWVIQNESFQSWATRLANELGCTIQIEGKRCAIAPRNEGKSASGKPLTAITAEWGVNLESWSISPIMARPDYKKVKGRYYDRKEAKWKTVEVEVPEGGADAELTIQLPEVDEESAKARATSQSKESERDKGGGTVTIMGEWRARPEAPVTIKGARPGVDGSYVADAVNHTVSKGGGFKTEITIKRPSGGAGKDSRKPSGSSAPSAPSSSGGGSSPGSLGTGSVA